MRTFNFKVHFDRAYSYISRTEDDINNDVFETLPQAKKCLKTYVQEQRKEYKALLARIKALRRADDVELE